MRKVINSIPLPMSGLMLGVAAAGNLLASYGNIFKIILGIISFIIFLLLVIKLMWDIKAVMENLKNPAMAGIAATFPMGIIVLSTYVHSFLPLVAYGLWAIGITAHCISIIYFTKKFIFKFSMQEVYPSCFVVYVGIGIVSIVAPVFNAAGVGRILFWFAFIAYIILLPIIIYRVFKIKSIPESLLPTITIFAAPASLCLAGYINSFQERNMMIIWLLAFLSVTMLFAVLLYIPKILKLKFYPSYSALTFPFVISAMATKTTDSFLIKMHMGMPALRYVVHFEELLAVVFVIYVLIRYIGFISLQYINMEPQIVQDAVKQYNENG